MVQRHQGHRARFALVNDDTRGQRADEALRHSEALLRSITDHSEHMIFVKDAALRYAFMNPACCRLHGLEPRQLIGRTDAECHSHTAEAAAFLASDRRVMRQKRTVTVEEEFSTPTGQRRVLLTTKTPRLDGRNNVIGVIGISRDITERKRAEEQLRSLALRLEERVTERTAELRKANETLHEEMLRRRELESEILSVIEREQRRIGRDLHDGLCQMTTATAMMSEGLGRDLAELSLPQEAKTARRITELIQTIGDEARRLSRGLSPVALEADGLTIALEDLAISTSKLFQVHCRFNCAGPVLIADHRAAIHLFRITQEAVNNAVRHARPRRIEIGLQRERSDLVLTISDDGSGMPQQPPSGRGMGLHVMRYRADMIGGSIRFKRGPRGGTIVTCLVPSRILKRSTDGSVSLAGE
jgi:two-component system sensor kinase FixL